MCMGVPNDLKLCDDVTLGFLDMTWQHLQFLPLPPECPCKSGVTGIVMGESDLGGFVHPFSFALTMDSPKFLVLLKLTVGFGTESSSSWVGLIICFSLLVSRSGVYSAITNVSRSLLSCLSFGLSSSCLCTCGTESCTSLISLSGYPLSLNALYFLPFISSNSGSLEQALSSLVCFPLSTLLKVCLGWAEERWRYWNLLVF